MSDLNALLKYLNSGFQNQAADASTMQGFGGDSLLQSALKYDPNARFEDVQTAEGGAGRKLVVDIEKLPKSQQGKAGFDLRTTDHATRMKDPSAWSKDDAYGDVTNSKNFYKERDATWTKFAPALVGGAAMLGPMLAAAGIGLAGAGATSAVTGAAAGLGGASIPTGMSSLPSWLQQVMTKIPQHARGINEGSFNPMSLLGAAGNAFGINPNYVSGGMTLAQLAGRKRP